MPEFPDRLLTIGEAAEIIGVAPHLLRQWEAKFPQLKPKRSRTGRRQFRPADVAVAKRIKQLLHHERMTVAGARVRLAQELHGEGRPRTRQEAIDLADKIEAELRALLDLLDSVS